MVARLEFDEENIDDSSTFMLATLLYNRARRLQEWASMTPRAPASVVHVEIRLIHEAFEALRERFGEEKGENCTVCDEGFYSNDHCTYCGHEQYQ